MARELSQVLRGHGLRFTPQRRLILQALEQSQEHVSAEQLHAQVQARYPQLHISTVYRTLELLRELGMATETDLGEGRLRYHFRERGHHHHLICHRCGAVVEMEESLLLPLKAALQKRYGFQADLSHLALFGLCSRCR